MRTLGTVWVDQTIISRSPRTHHRSRSARRSRKTGFNSKYARPRDQRRTRTDDSAPEPERLAFLNRGQAWVVRKLEELLPRERDHILHAALNEMRASHVENIRLTQQCIAETKT